jgi:SMODS-associating 2TM, beta-strand rich effector domain
MSKSDLKRFVQITAGITVAVLALLIWAFDGMRLGPKTFDRVSSAVSATVVFWLVFAKCGWKLWPFSLLFTRPNIGGTWIGHLESDWQRGVQQPGVVIPIAFAIRQTFFSLLIYSLTKDRAGLSDVANLVVKEESGVTYLSYVYSLRDEFRAGMGTQQGAAELRLIGGGASPELRGEYWTNTKTRGRLILRRSSDDLVGSFDDARQRWPLAQWPMF